MVVVKKGQWLILITNIIYLVIALFIFSSRKNYEFIMYVGVIIVFLVLIILTNSKVDYPNFLLWGLTLWGIMHMLGGGYLLENGNVLYKLIILNISETYAIFRYDQLVHIIGFGIATLAMYVLIKPNLKNKTGGASLAIVLAMAGLGVGALNEIIEFTATVIMPETGVGGFINSSMDLVADLIGSIIAVFYIRLKNGNI